MHPDVTMLPRSARLWIAAVLLTGCQLAACSVEISHPRDELTLPPVTAFARTTDHDVHSVHELGAAEFDRALKQGVADKREWTMSPKRIAQHFAGYYGPDGLPRSPRGSTRTTPTESWVRVCVSEEGWEDDSIAGKQTVVWLVPDRDGGFTVQRVLQAQLCRRPGATFYSAEPCP